MGLLEKLKGNNTPVITSMLPQVAVDEIYAGRLPVLRTSRVFLKSGEICHYMDSAVFEKENKKRHTVRHSGGYSVPGLFKGTRVHIGTGNADTEEIVTYQQITGTLFITNKRVIFVGNEDGFDEKIENLSAVTPYANCIQLQFSSKRYRLFVPNGNVPYRTLQLIT